MIKKLLISITILFFSILFCSAQKDKTVEIQIADNVIEYVNGPIDIAITVPQLVLSNQATDAQKNLQKNLNYDACVNIQKAVNAKETLPTSGIAANLDLLELHLLSHAKSHIATFATDLSYRLYSDWQAFSNNHLVSVFQKIYYHDGGVRGISFVNFSNYKLATGERVDISSRIEDRELFMVLLVKYFCKERKLPFGAPKTETGLIYELEELPFPTQIGLTKKGIVVLYQPYEIAPGSFGAIAVTIPAKELEDIFGDDFFKVHTRKGGTKLFNERKAMERHRSKN